MSINKSVDFSRLAFCGAAERRWEGIGAGEF